MCGICGVVRTDDQPVNSDVLRVMNQRLQHRGPDGEGYHVDSSAGLGMRRLSIIDVAGSDQPLYNEDRSLAVVFNGELYNFQQVRQQLESKGHRFRTQGDGEIIPHLYEEYGIDAIKQISGQFALALWDENEKRLLLARDRMGQKPLYYYQGENLLVFASEIKALLAHPEVPCESAFDDPQTLALYLGYGYIPAPTTAFKGIQMLMPRHVLTFSNNQLQTIPYWELPPQAPERTISDADEAAMVEKVRDSIESAVQERLISDVPLGAFLSGGLDSSLIVALMQKHMNAPVETFSIGFEGDDSFDESSYAEKVADAIGSKHTTFRVKPDALDLLPKLVWHYDQPFADSSAIPTYLVSELTRHQVTVALTGDGGDEVFAGYERFYAASLVKKLGLIPRPLWKGLGSALSAMPEGTGYYNTIKRARRFIHGASQSPSTGYFDWVRLFNADWVNDLTQQADISGEHFANYFVNGATLPEILAVNMQSYLPDDLLIKADRCSMAASLEARAPFLSHELIELVADIPMNLKLKGNTTKYILKQAAKGFVPDDIIHRPKHGFGVPLGAWLKKDMQPVRNILQSETARNRQLFNAQAVERLLNEHETGKRDHGHRIWTLLTLENWHEQFIDQRVGDNHA